MIVLVICATVMKYHRDIEEHKPAGCGTDEPMTAVVSNSQRTTVLTLQPRGSLNLNLFSVLRDDILKVTFCLR